MIVGQNIFLDLLFYFVDKDVFANHFIGERRINKQVIKYIFQPMD